MLRTQLTPVVSRTAFGRFLCGDKRYTKYMNESEMYTILANGNGPQAPVGVYIPYELWFQIQHFVHTVLERR